MFLRSVKAANGRHEYLRLVENYRQGDKIRQRVVLHVGRKDLLAPHLDALGAPAASRSAGPHLGFDASKSPRRRAWTWGPVLVARHLFDSLSLGALLDGTTPCFAAGQPLSERVFPLVANRLTRPGSEHALAGWLEDFYVVTAEGQPLDAGVETVAPGQGELRTTAAVVRNPGRVAGRERASGGGRVAATARPVQRGAGVGVLRHHLDLLRGTRTGGVGADSVTAGMASRATGRSWWGW